MSVPKILAYSLFLALFAFPAFSGNLDPTYKDQQVGALLRVFKLPGAIQIDSMAIEGGANEWNIKVEEVTLKGKTNAVLDKSWGKLLAAEHEVFLKILKNRYQDGFPQDAKLVTEESVKKFAKDLDITVRAEQGINDKKIQKWLVDEVLTRSGLSQADFYVGGSADKREIDYVRLHYHDSNSEILGEDLLLIRGVKRVLVVRISYMHA